MSRGRWKGGRGGQRGWRGRDQGRGRGGRGRDGGGGGDRGPPRWNRSRDQISRQNKAFEQYYNKLEVVAPEEQDLLWEAMRSDLPNSFRFAGSRGHALTVQRRLVEHYIPEITSVTWDGQPVAPPTPVQWFPDQLAWSMTTPKNVIRKFPPFASFQKFLVSENNVGNITRQEVVSMIPPLLLDIKPGMTVLDLCAAPGSKSAQIIELVHGGEEARVRKVLEKVAKDQGRELSPEGMEVDQEKRLAATEDDWSDDGRSTGLLVANDVDWKRAQMLVHQCKRLNSPNLIVTNHDATLFPSIKIPSESGNKYLKFDRILADVPCSGDGTCRKNPEIWLEWSQSKSLGLHTTQVRILVRALQMLKVGGRVVYSTCSMNPIENEAVVASAVDRCGGSTKVKLVDKDDAIPGLKRKPGLTNWKVMDKAGRWWDSWEEVCEAKVEQGEHNMSKLAEGMFPPASDTEIQLDRCVRIYPHLQDTGGFFIAVLEKQTEIKTRPENPANAVERQVAPSVTAVADEIKEKAEAGENDLSKIDALDGIAPPVADPPETSDDQQPQEAQGYQSEPFTRKRSLEEGETGDANASNKKLKTDNEEAPGPVTNDGIPLTESGHPRPPGAELEFTADGNNPSLGSPPRIPLKREKPMSSSSPEEAFIYLAPDHPDLLSIYSFYALSPRFPRDRFLVRNPTGQPVKAIYYTSSFAGDVLRENDGRGIRFVHAGVKMFVKQDVHNQPDACKWRIQAEGLPIVEAWVGEGRVVRLRKRETLRKLLLEMFPKISGESWRELGEVGQRVKDLGAGCCVLRVEPSEDNDPEGFRERLVMPLWRGLGSLNLMLPKEDRKAMLLRLFNDDSPLVDHAKERFANKNENAGEEAGEVVQESKEQQVDRLEAVEDDEDNEEDGGVSLAEPDPVSVAEAEEMRALAASAEDNAEHNKNAMEAEMQEMADNTKEVAPGVTDEDESFNKTV